MNREDVPPFYIDHTNEMVAYHQQNNTKMENIEQYSLWNLRRKNLSQSRVYPAILRNSLEISYPYIQSFALSLP